MTEEDRHDASHEYNGRSASQLAHELCRLVLVLAWRFIIWLIRRLVKGILWCIRTTEKGLARLNTWWNDNDTQEKKAKIIAWVKMAMRKTGELCVLAGKKAARGALTGLVYAGKGLKIVLKATAIGIVIGTKATIQGIMHMRTTLKRLRRLSAVAYRSIKRWNTRRKRGDRLRQIKRQRALDEFRRNGGMKGIIVKYSNNIRKNITMFMEEDQDESDPDALTNEELMEKTLENGASKGNKRMKIGQSILTHTKDLLDSK